MTKLIKPAFFFIIYFFFFISLQAAAVETEVTIFDVGQGNCVSVRHGKEVILFDAGSTEMSYSRLYEKLYGVDEQRYRYRTLPLNKGDEEDDEVDEEDEKSLDISIDEEEDGDPASEAIDTETAPDIKGTSSSLGERLRNKLLEGWEEGEECKVKAAVISHADIDHYMLLSHIFNSDLTLGTLVLGGQPSEYSEDFIDWINERNKEDDDGIVIINEIIYTGTSDGKEKTETLARPYSSGYRCEVTAHEDRIIKSLEFTEEGRPIVEVLAMNASHGLTPAGIPYLINPGKNTGSMIVRIKTDSTSLLITGDAEAPTWNFVRANYIDRLEELETQYVLLSHHGSAEYGANNKEFLEIFKPKVCFISAGVNTKYGHPSAEVIDRLLDDPGLDIWTDDTREVISYFRHIREKKVRKRRMIKKLIMSTIDWGDISFKLKDEFKLYYTRDRSAALKQGEEDIVFKKKKGKNHRPIDIVLGEGVAYTQKNYLKKFKELHPNKMKRLFYMPSGRHNLVIPLKGVEVTKRIKIYYVYDTKTKRVYPVEIK